MFKTNRNYPFIHDAEVIEWDIKSANTSVMEYYQLAEDSLIKRLSKLSKIEREVAVGKLQQKKPEFAKQLEKAFNDIIEEFMRANNLDDDDIVSIKRDAVFVKNHVIKNHTFGPVKFIPKNSYKHVVLLPKYEVYVSDSTTDVKGIADEVINLHQCGMILFLRSTVYTAHDFYELQRFFHQFVEAYKKKELDFDMYREFNSDSKFRVRSGDQEMLLDDIEEDDMNGLDISFNYVNVVMATIQATY